MAEERAQVEGEANLARRAVADFEKRILQRREELAAAEEYEQACRAFDAAAEQRDSAARSLASAARELIARFDQLASARTALAAARNDVRRRFGDSALDSLIDPGEPEALTEAWDSLRERLQNEVDKNLDEELLEAAANSPFPPGADRLPPHLLDAGRRRWMERRRQSRQH